MRQLSERRRRLVATACGASAMSGVGPALSRHHPRLEWVWLGLLAALLVWVIVMMVRLNSEEGCG